LSEDKKTGVFDPWRIEPDLPGAPKEPQKPARIDLHDKDWDSDLRPIQTFEIRAKSCSIEISGKELTSLNMALVKLVKACIEIFKTHPQMFPEMTFELEGFKTQLPPKGSKYAGYRTTADHDTKAAIFFWNQSVDSGMQNLVRELNRFRLTPKGTDLLDRWRIKTITR